MTVRTRPALDSLPAYVPGRSVAGAIKLASNELPFPPHDAVHAAINEAIAMGAHSVNRYPDMSAQRLMSALEAHTSAPAERLIAGCGSVALCQQIVQAVAGEGDEVVFGWRSFEAYPIVTQITGATAVRVPVTAGHELDLPAIAEAVGSNTRVVFVCTPNNPTGTAIRRDALVEFLDEVPSDVLVVIDEAYREFGNADDPPDGLEFALSRPNVVALRTLSKAYALAGLRVGYAVGDPVVITAMRKVQIPFALNSLAQHAAIAALGVRDELAPLWRQIIDERGRVTAALRGLGYEIPDSQANFVWLPLRERAAEFAAHCEASGIIVRAFSDASGGVRTTIGTAEENDAFLAAAGSFPR